MEIPSSDDGSQLPQILRSSTKSSAITASFTQYHLFLPEYPETSDLGICHIIPIEKWDTQDSLQDRPKNVSYTLLRPI